MRIISPDKPNNLVMILLIVCIFSIPFALFFSTTSMALLILFASLFPAYSILKKSEIPQSVTFNFDTKCIDLISISGIKSKSILFRHIEDVSIGSFEEFSDSNAFKNEVSQMIYYVTIEARGKKYDVFRFNNTEINAVLSIQKELNEVMSR